MINKRFLKGIGFLACLLSATSIFAAPGIRGMAVYRDGVIGAGSVSLNWHAGIFADYDINSSNLPIIHIGGPGQQVDCVSYDEFLDKGYNNFKGVYWQDETNSSGRREISSTAYELVGEDIDYVFDAIILPHNTSKTTGYFAPSGIDKIRCDGVVEYCHEWPGYEVRRFDNKWDISGYGSYTAHNKYWKTSGPKQQANVLTKIYSSVY